MNKSSSCLYTFFLTTYQQHFVLILQRIIFLGECQYDALSQKTSCVYMEYLPLGIGFHLLQPLKTFQTFQATFHFHFFFLLNTIKKVKANASKIVQSAFYSSGQQLIDSSKLSLTSLLERKFKVNMNFLPFFLKLSFSSFCPLITMSFSFQLSTCVKISILVQSELIIKISTIQKSEVKVCFYFAAEKTL